MPTATAQLAEKDRIMQNALNKLINYVDPEFPNGIPALPTHPTVAASEAEEAEETEWVTWTGTYYPTLESVPWQARGSAIEVPARR
jgi:hypothetical protein